MKFIKVFCFALLIPVTTVFFGCGVNFIATTPTPKLSAPPVEGESSAPPLEVSAEEIITEKNTPAGVCVKDEANDALNCFDTNGLQLYTMPVPGIGSADPQTVFITGALKPESATPSVIYRSWEPEQALLMSDSIATITLKKTNTFLALAGSLGQPFLAFSEVVYENDFPHSFLFAGSLETLGSEGAFYDLNDTLTGMVLIPVTVDAAGGQGQQVWYTQSPWGIGGADLIYPINRGLYLFDLKTSQNMQALGTERNFQGLSPDNTLAGSISFDLRGDHSMRVTNLASGHMINFPLNPSSDRGAGYAVFSIDDELVAWMEASGSMIAEPASFQPRIRVGEIAKGTVIHELDSTMAAQALGWKQVLFMKPVGWMDTQTLVIEARGSDWKTVSLTKFDIASGSLTPLCQGSFAGFTYP